MDFFTKTTAVKLQSHLGKYLVPGASIGEPVRQKHGAERSRASTWVVERVEGRSHVVRLRSCHGGYLAATEEPFLMGMTGNKVAVAPPVGVGELDQWNTEWEPVRYGLQVQLKSWCGKYLRANGGTPPWRNSVTHDEAYTGSTKKWILWDVEAEGEAELASEEGGLEKYLTSMSSLSSVAEDALSVFAENGGSPRRSDLSNLSDEHDPVSEEIEQTAQHPAAPITSQFPATIQWPYMPWVPVQGSWAAGTHQWIPESGQQWAPQQQPNPTGDPDFVSPGQRPEFIPGGMPSNPNFPPGFVPLPFPNNAGRPEPGDPLYTSPADGPELKLITLQLAGPDHYSTWARDFRRALVTKDKDGFLDGSVPLPADDRMQRHWRRCNHLVRTWIRNCVTAEVAAGLPPFRSQILAMVPVPPLGRIFQLAVQEENQRLATTGKERGGESIVLAAPGKNLGRSHGVFRASQRGSSSGSRSGGNARLTEGGEEEEDFFGNPRTYRPNGQDQKQGSDGTRAFRIDGGDYRRGRASDGPYAARSDGHDQRRPHGSDGSYAVRSDGPDQRRSHGSAGPFSLPYGAELYKGGGQNSKFKGKYCEYSHRPHHTIETCWKLHGKPANKEKKGKEFSAYQVSAYENNPAHQPLTQDQYEQIMKTLNQLKIELASDAQIL